MFFLYDENGGLYGFVKDEKKYFYIKDITGTILGIVNESGTLVGKYEYSAYGKCTILVDTDGIAKLNPFRFKCYYYDTESGMYYCQTRYFVPEWGRWLNADSPNFLQFDNINGMNLFAYCNNSPVMYADPSGKIGLLGIFISMAIGGLIGGALSYAEASKANLTGWDKLLATLGGAIFGAATSGAFALGGAAVTGLTVAGKTISGVTLFGIATFGTATAGALNYTLKSIAYDTPMSWEGALMSMSEGAFEGIISFGIGAFAGVKKYFRFAEKSVFNPHKTLETVMRSVLFSLPSSLLRSGFKRFYIEWGVY